MINGHAQCSPSGADGWMACAGWESSPESSKYADEGTDAHTLGAIVLSGSHCSCMNLIGHTLPLGRVVDQRMALFLDQYVDLVRSLPGVLMVEQRLPLHPITGEEDSSGTSDVVKLNFEALEIIIVDLKYGSGVRVHAKASKQLKHYGLAALLEYDDLAKWKSVRAIICQPRIEDGVSEDTFTRAELLQFKKESFKAAKSYRKHHAKPLVELFSENRLHASKKGCRWCRKERKDVCAAHAAMKMAEHTVEFSPI